MAIDIIISNDMWNDKKHAPTVESWDPIDVHVRFDQPIMHELGYVDADVTTFWLDVLLGDELIATLRTKKVLAELSDEARSFKNGRFKLALCKAPDALSQHFHATFPDVMAGRDPGSYPVTLRLQTDNAEQKDKILAECTFTFQLAPGSADYLKNVAQQNRDQGADQDDAAELERRAAAYAARRVSALATGGTGAAAASTARVKLTPKRDLRVRLHTGPGQSMATNLQQHVTSDWHTLQVGSVIELLGEGDQKVGDLTVIAAAMDGTTLSLA